MAILQPLGITYRIHVKLTKIRESTYLNVRFTKKWKLESLTPKEAHFSSGLLYMMKTIMGLCRRNHKKETYTTIYQV